MRIVAVTSSCATGCVIAMLVVSALATPACAGDQRRPGPRRRTASAVPTESAPPPRPTIGHSSIEPETMAMTKRIQLSTKKLTARRTMRGR